MSTTKLGSGSRASAALALVGLVAGLLAGPAGAAPARAAHGARRARPALHSPPTWYARSSGGPLVTQALVRHSGRHPSPYRAVVAYPVVHGSGPAIARVDTALRTEARRSVARFVRGLPPGPLPKGVPETASTLSTTVQTDLLTDRLAGFSSLTYQFPAGAAHGLELVTTGLYDLRTGAPVRLAGLFRPGADYLALLSRESRAQLRARLGPLDVGQLIDEGTTPKATNFTGWALTPFGLQVTFSDYQVGPYAIGTPTITIPFARLAPLARPRGPIGLAEAARPPRTALLPATVPPVVAECYRQAGPSAPFPPATCRNGRLNVAAWNELAGFEARVLHLGRTATPSQVRAAVCADARRFAAGVAGARHLERVAAAYFGWRFASSPIAGYPRTCPGR